MEDLLNTYFPSAPDSVFKKSNIKFGHYYYILPYYIIEEKSEYTDNDLIYCKMYNFDKSRISEEIDFYPNGISIEGLVPTINQHGKLDETLTSGIVVYPASKYNIITTKAGTKIRATYTDENQNVCYQFLNTEWVKNNYKLYYMMKLNDDFSVLVNVSGDLLFDSVESAQDFSKSLYFNYAEIDSERLMLYMNYKIFYIRNYYIYYKNQLTNYDHDSFFNFISSNIKTDIGGKFAHQKKYALTPLWLEVIPVSELI